MQPDDHDILTLVLGVLDREPDANRILGDLLEESGHVAAAQWARAKKTKIRQRVDLALGVLPADVSLELVTDFVEAWMGKQSDHTSGVIEALMRRKGRTAKRITGLLETVREWLSSANPQDAKQSEASNPGLAAALEQLERVSFDGHMRLTIRQQGSRPAGRYINSGGIQSAEQLFCVYAAAVRKLSSLRQDGRQSWVNEELSGYMRRAAALAVYHRPDDLVTQFKLVRQRIVVGLENHKAETAGGQ